MEGKEVRFGIANSALFTTVTTDASCGAVNNMHDSLTPIGGMVPMVNIMLGEIIFGGVGSGLYGMLLFAILAVFIAGLMVGRTPEYLGKKIEAKEVKMAMLAILILPLSILGFTAIAVVAKSGLAGLANGWAARFQRSALRLHLGHRQQWQRVCGPVRQHGLLQHHPWPGDVHWTVLDDRPDARNCRFARAQENRSRTRRAHFRLTALQFVLLVIGVIFILGGLTYFPALALGPIVEHLAMIAGQTF